MNHTKFKNHENVRPILQRFSVLKIQISADFSWPTYRRMYIREKLPRAYLMQVESVFSSFP